MSHFYDFTAERLHGGSTSMRDFTGQVVLVVNTASQCGFTPQYAGLETLYRTYHSQGFVVLGFPCNQFGRQEPGDADTIAATCQRHYGVTFPMFAKIEVNGRNAHPLFQHLTTALPGWFGRSIRWNFTKFVLGRDGTPLRRFAPFTKPARLESAITAALHSS